MYFWRTFVAAIKPRNWGLLIYILLSNGLIFGCGFLIGATVMAGNGIQAVGELRFDLFLGAIFVAANVGLSFLMLSDIGEFFSRILLFKSRLIKYKPGKPYPEEYDRLYNLFQEAHEEARNKSKLVPKRIKLFIAQSADTNACVIGMHTMVVNEGLIAQLDDLGIKGVLAHEFGHMSNSDTVLSMTKISANTLLSLIVGFIVAILRLAILIGFVTEDSDNTAARVFGFIMRWFIGVILSWIVKGILNLWMLIGFMFEMFASRRQEYKADEFAVKIGEGNNLLNALQIIDDSPHRRTSIFDGMTSTHPYTADRIVRLKKLLGEGNTNGQIAQPGIII